MIVRSLCNTCLQRFELLLKPGDAPLLRQIAQESGKFCPCPRLCGGMINLQHDPAIEQLQEGPRLRDPMTLTGAQLYQAVNGAGLPDEIPKDEAVIDSLLRANHIVKCALEHVGDRIYLHELHLSNGSVIHLAAGGRGAQVLKVTRGVGA